MKFSIIAQPLLAVAALAAPTSNNHKRDLQTIQSGISSVQKSLSDLGTAVNAVDPADATTLTNVLTASTNAQGAISSATTSIKATSALSLTDALSLQQSASGLTTTANQTVSALIAKKPVFDMLGVTSEVGNQLQTQKTGATGLGDAIVSKVPAIGQGIAQKSIGQINTVLAQAITAYSAAGTTPAASNSTAAVAARAHRVIGSAPAPAK